MKTFILSFLKHIKSFNNLLFNLSIKSVSSFSYIKLVMKYYSYFRYILEYFKGNRFYTIFKAFFKVISLINILLGIFVLIVFTDFRYEDYKIFIQNNLIHFSFSEFFTKFRESVKGFFKYILSLFGDDDLEPVKTPNSDKLPDTYNLGKGNIKYDSYAPYYCFLAFVTIVVCFKYPEYTITPIVSGITAFFSSLFGGNDDPSGSNNHLDKGKGRAHTIDTINIDHLRTLQSDSESNAPTSTSSTKSFIQKYFPIFENKTVSSIGEDPHDKLSGNLWGKMDSPKSSTSDLNDYFPETTAHISQNSSGSASPTGSTDSSATVTQSTHDTTSTPTTHTGPTTPTTPTTPSGSKPFRPRWSPTQIKDPWK